MANWEDTVLVLQNGENPIVRKPTLKEKLLQVRAAWRGYATPPGPHEPNGPYSTLSFPPIPFFIPPNTHLDPHFITFNLSNLSTCFPCSRYASIPNPTPCQRNLRSLFNPFRVAETPLQVPPRRHQ